PAPAWPMVLAFSTSPTTTESISLSLHDALPISGHMRIATDNGSVYFAVEEYKRPKFEVAFDTVKANIALNEEITIRGRATAYAGDRKSTRLNSSHVKSSYAVFCLKKKHRRHTCF